MKRFLITLFISASLCAPWLSAQDFSGSMEARLGWSWGASDLAPQTQVAEGRVDGRIGPADLPCGQYSARVKVVFDPATAASSLSLGEAWIKLFAGPFDLSFGNQVVAWSVCDAFWPSDVVNPWDMSLPVDPVRMPVPLARALWTCGPISLDLVVHPWWFAAVTPASRWLPSNALADAGFTLTFADNKPAFDWENVAYGGHLKASVDLLQGLDLGATFHRGRLSTARSVVAITGMSSAAIDLEYDPATMVGADLVLAPGAGFLLKTEWAYTALRDTSLLEPEADAATLEGVSGLEYSIGSFQVIGEYVYDWAKGNTALGDTERHSAVLILSGDVGSRLSLKVAGIYDFSDGGSGMVTPQISYTLADGLSLACVSWFFMGDPATRYGAWKDNALGRISLKYSF